MAAVLQEACSDLQGVAEHLDVPPAYREATKFGNALDRDEWTAWCGRARRTSPERGRR